MPDLEGAVLDTPTDATTLGDEVVEQPDDELSEGEETSDESPDEEADGESEGEETEGEQEAVSPDGRKMSDGLKKAIATIKTTHPEAAKEIKGLYFANQEYRTLFPKPADAAAAKNLIDEVGGQEGIQQIASEREEWGTIDKQFAEGSADFAKSIATANPEAFVKNAPHMVNEWAQRAPEQYAYFAQALTVNMMKSIGMPDKLEKAYNAASDNPQLQSVIADAYNSIVDMNEKAQQFSQKRVDPREEKLNQDRQQFEQQRRGSFEEGIAKQAESYLSEKMKPEVERILGGRTIDAEASATITSLVTAEIQKRMSEIPGFGDKLEAFYRTGDAQKSIDYIKAQYNRLLPEATKKVVAPLYRNIAPTPAKKPVVMPNGKPAIRAEVTLRDMPEWKDIDFAKCTTADVASGWAILKSGKKASGWV